MLPGSILCAEDRFTSQWIAMDCPKALEILDCIRPKSDDLELPEFAEARAHTESCESCRLEFSSRQEFDAAIAAVVQDVDVPESLRDELLSSALLNVDADEQSRAIETERRDDAGESTVHTRPRRRTLLLAAASVTCCIAAIGLGLWLRDSGPEQFSVAELLQQVDVQQDNADAFDESFVFQPPSGWSHDGLRLGRDLHGQDLDGESGHEVASLLFSYSLTDRQLDPISGVIMAIPANRVKPPPAASFSRATPHYLPGDMVALAWTENDLVYVVIISGSASGLEELQRAFSGIAA